MTLIGNRQANVYWLLVAPLLVLVLVFYAWPVLGILWLSFTDPEPGLGNYAQLFDGGSLTRILWKTFRICLVTTVISVAIGYLIAYAMTHLGRRERSWMLALVLVSFWVSVLVRAFAWLTLLSRNGLVNGALMGAGLTDEPLALVRNELGVLIGMVHYMIPYAVLPILANMQGIDQRVVSASRGLGAGALYTFARIYLPLSLPGIFAGGLLVFIISLGFYVTPVLLGGGRVLMVAEYVSVQVLVTVQWGTASMLATMLLIGVFALMLTLSRFMRIGELFGARA
ncbi:MAG TPA: ABC transporter permease [Thermohalobaculum sp.]|nr:ABC transporter permease [Thermohalobaculum sp.]